jgi:hypothetical protein
MSDKSQELLLGLSVEAPEMDSDEQEIDDMLENANLVSSIRDILDNMGKEDFRFVWAIQFEFIRNEPFYQHARFAEQLLEKVFSLYEYQFPEKLYFFTKEQVNRVYDFIKFLEYDNVEFITLICRMLKLDVMKENIKIYCEQNSMKIIKEVEEQLGTYQQPELISIFLRTYMKDDFIKWFSKQVKRSKFEIAEKIYESEEQ